MNWKQANKEIFWPTQEERGLLGRFYLAGGLSEMLNVIHPFEFIYLFLIMERPEWAIIPLVTETAAVLLMEVPTGVVADRWGRKSSVICGDLVSALSWALVPLAASLRGANQLLAVSLCFTFDGIGQTLVSGAEEAWVVDNLRSVGKEDLTEQYFARIRSFSSLGGVFAGSLSILLLFMTKVDRNILNLLWYISALGQLLGVGIAAIGIPEYQVSQDKADFPEEEYFEDIEESFKERMVKGFKIIVQERSLFFFFLALVGISFAGSITSDAFEISLITKGLDARGLAPLDIVNDMLGMITPLIGIAMAKIFGITRSLVFFIILPAVSVGIFFLQPKLMAVVGLFLFFNIFDDFWDPVADARLHEMIPSRYRATIGSIVNQVSESAGLCGLGIFALLLKGQSSALQRATPKLPEAFSGRRGALPRMPNGVLGLPISDFALVIFTLSSLIAVPFLVVSYRKRSEEKR